MAANECDFTSSFFDPLKALYTAGLQPPVPNVHVFNNVNEYAQSLKLGRIVQKGGKQEGNKLKGQDDGEGSLGQRLKNIAYSKPRSRNRDPKRLAHLMKVKSKTDGIEEKVAMLEKTKKKPQQKNVLQRMEDNYKQGPLSILYNCIEQRKQLRVWTRRLKSLRGVCVGYLVAFDKHMNLAMMDVDEMFAIEEEVEVDPMKMAERIEKKKKKKRTWRRRKRQLLRNRVLSDDVNSDVKNLESRSITGVGETGNHQREPNFYQDNVFQFSFRMAEPEDVAVKKFANDASNTFDYKNTPQLNDVCCHGSSEGKSESNKQSGEDNDCRVEEELSIGERESSRHEDERRTNNDLAEWIDECTAVEEAHVIEERIHVNSRREEIGTTERNTAVLRLKDEVQHETVRTDINEVKPLVRESGHSQGKETTLSSERVKDEVKQNSLNEEEKVARSNEEEKQVILFDRSCDNGDQGSKDKVEMNVEGGKATLSSERVKDEVKQMSLNEEEMVAKSNEEDRHGILFGRSWDDGDQGSEDKAETDVEDEKTTLDSEHTKYVVRQKMSNEEKVAVSNEEEKLDTRSEKGNRCDRDGKSKLDVEINVEVNEDDKKVEQQNSENENGGKIFTKNESVASTRNTRADEKDETEMVSTCSETSTSEMAEIESKFIESVNIVLRTETETEMESTNKMCGELTTLNKGCISSFEEKLPYGGENKDKNKNLSVYKLSSEPNVLTSGKNAQGNTGTGQDVQSTEERRSGGEEETMGLEMNPQYLHEPCTRTENEQNRLGMLSKRRSYCADRLGKPRMEITFSNVTDVGETKSKTIDSEDINSKCIDSENIGLSTDTQVNMKATHSGSTCMNLDDQRSSCEEGEIRSNEEDQDDNKNRNKQKANLEPSILARDKTAHHIVNSTGKTTAENKGKREKEEGELSSSDDEGRASSCEEGEIISSGEENEVKHRKKDLETFSDNKTKGIKYKEKMNKSQGEQGKQSQDSGRKYSGKLAKESGRKTSVKRPKDSSGEHSSNRAKDSGRENSGNRTKNFDRENVGTRTKDSAKKDTGKRANYSGTLKGKDFSVKILESKSKVGSSKDVATPDMFSRRAEKGTIERKHRTQTSISSQGKARGSEDKLRYATKYGKLEEREQDRLRNKTEKQDSWTKETSRIRRSSLETKRNTNAKETNQKDSMTETSANSKARRTSTGMISQNKNVCKGGTKNDELKMSSSLIRTQHSSSEKIYYLTKETRRASRGKSVHDEIQKEKVKNRAQGVSCDKREKDVPQHDATRKSTNARDGEKGSKADSRGTESGKGLTIANNLQSNTENTTQNETAKGRKRTSDPSSVKEEKRNDRRGDDLSKKDCTTKLGRKEETTNAHKKQSQIKEANEVQLAQASRTSVAGERRGIFCPSSSKNNKGSDKTKTELAKKHNLHEIGIKPGTENVKKPKARNSDVKDKCLQQRGGSNGNEDKVFERDRNVASRTEDGVERSFMSSYSSTKISGCSISAITEHEEKSRPSSKVDKPCSDSINAMQKGSSDTSSRRKSKTTDKVKQRQSENFQDLHTQTDTHGKEERRDGKLKSRPSLSKLGKSRGDGINNVLNRTEPSSSRKAVITEKKKSKQNENFQDSRNQTDARGQERRGERKSCSSSSKLDKLCGGNSINDMPKRSDTSGSRKLRVTENVRLPSKTESFQDLCNKTDTRTNKGEKNGKNDKDKSVERKSNKGYTSAADGAFTGKNISRENMKSKQTKSIFSSSKENSRDRIKTSQKMKLSTDDSRKASKEAECTTQIRRNETHKSNTKRLGTREKSSITDKVKPLTNEPKVVGEKGKNTEKKSVEKSNVKAKPAEKHLKKNSAKKVCSKRKKDTDAAEPPSKVRRVGKDERPVKTKEAKLPGNVVTVRVLKVKRGKALVLKQRHVNQLFIRGDSVIMVAYENDQVKKN